MILAPCNVARQRYLRVDENADRNYRTEDTILRIHDGMSHAMRTGNLYRARPPGRPVDALGRQEYHNPWKVTAKRYTDAGVSKTKMFRTDRGDDEGALEWDHESIDGHHDRAGDDDVEIIITASGEVKVKYRKSD